MENMISLQNVTKKFGAKTVISNISLDIKKGEFLVFLGESGCGKTTTLKMINKLIPLTSGTIYVHKEDIAKTDTIALRRKIGYVIQDIGLFPLMTILDNMTIVQRLEHAPKEERFEKAVELLGMVGLGEEVLERYPDELSGGQQQRIGFARALANTPDIILMDEPFSALDPITRTQLQDEIVELQQKLGVTIVFVTHSIDEALRLADRICFFEKGKIVQLDTPKQILNNPANDYVRSFIGEDKLWQNPKYIEVSSIMSDRPIVISKNASLLTASQKMRAYNVDVLLVVDKKAKFFGVLEMEQLLRVTINPETQVKDIAETSFEVLRLEAKVDDALEIMITRGQKIVPVINKDGALVGIVTRSRLFKEIGAQFIERDTKEAE